MFANYGLLLVIYLTKCICESTNIESHLYQLRNLTSSESRPTLVGENSLSKVNEHAHYVQPPEEYLQNFEDLLKSSNRNQPLDSIHRNPHFLNIDIPHKSSASIPNVQMYRLIPYQERLLHHIDDESDFTLLKKHDFPSGQDFGWNIFPTGHGNTGGFGLGHGNGGGFGSNHGSSGGALKKGKEAKTLFILMAPLILLAVFGPILATQAMLPWVANGGLTSVSTIAGGKRRKRQTSQNFDPRQRSEMESRLHLFMEVQDFIARTGSQDLVQEMGEAFLRCQKYSERRNKCLERVACAFTDPTSAIDHDERRIGRMVLRNVMSNPLFPSSLTGKLKKGFLVGKHHPGNCVNFWCDVVDNPKNKSK
ncbi:hypothetical protein HNY73_019768 [Argiope bruennichi]|uniref:Uncharacterized protein n=1 Tax=Argiope bruennichi TaxID=94029 RepID=A0A8T0E5G1_ARGBR|nr:hypothetical protein HNY73_019768 [Argiope bruennichi]